MYENDIFVLTPSTLSFKKKLVISLEVEIGFSILACIFLNFFSFS